MSKRDPPGSSGNLQDLMDMGETAGGHVDATVLVNEERMADVALRRAFLERNRRAADFSPDFVQKVALVIHNDGWWEPMFHIDAVLNDHRLHRWLSEFCTSPSPYDERGPLGPGPPFALSNGMGDIDALYANDYGVVYDVGAGVPFTSMLFDKDAPAWMGGATAATVPVQLVIVVAPETAAATQRIYSVLHGKAPLPEPDEDATDEEMVAHDQYQAALHSLRSDVVVRVHRLWGEGDGPVGVAVRSALDNSSWSCHCQTAVQFAEATGFPPAIVQTVWSIVESREHTAAGRFAVAIAEAMTMDPARAMQAVVRLLGEAPPRDMDAGARLQRTEALVRAVTRGVLKMNPSF